jgi:nickel superoxide dismutase
MKNLFSEFTPVTVHAHCDVPCGIYDPSGAVIAAKTVARMVELITQAEIGGPATLPATSSCAASPSKRSMPRG